MIFVSKSKFQLEEKTVNEWDGHVSWKSVDEMVATLTPRTGTIQLEGQQEQETIRYDVVTNWRPGLFKGQVERRLVHEDGRKFYVESVMDVDELHREFKLSCTLR